MILPTYNPNQQELINRLLDERLSELYGIHGKPNIRTSPTVPDGMALTDAVNLSQVTGGYVLTSRAIYAGNGLIGGGTLAADVTLSVGAGTGISVAANTVSIDETEDFTWTGLHDFSTVFPTTPHGDPTSDWEVVNKQYADAHGGAIDLAADYNWTGTHTFTIGPEGPNITSGENPGHTHTNENYSVVRIIPPGWTVFGYGNLYGVASSGTEDVTDLYYVNESFSIQLTNQDGLAVDVLRDYEWMGTHSFPSNFPTTPAAAPDADYEVANKKYVDDTSSGGSAMDFHPFLMMGA